LNEYGESLLARSFMLVATSPDDLFFWDCRSGRYEKTS